MKHGERLFFVFGIGAFTDRKCHGSRGLACPKLEKIRWHTIPCRAEIYFAKIYQWPYKKIIHWLREKKKLLSPNPPKIKYAELPNFYQKQPFPQSKTPRPCPTPFPRRGAGALGPQCFWEFLLFHGLGSIKAELEGGHGNFGRTKTPANFLRPPPPKKKRAWVETFPAEQWPSWVGWNFLLRISPRIRIC